MTTITQESMFARVPMVGDRGYPRLHFGTRELRRTAGEQLFHQPYERLILRPVGVTIGAVVEGVDLGAIDDETHAELHRALLEWKVLFFREQHLTGAEHIALAKRWGGIEANDFFPNGEVQAISRLAKDDTAVGMENVWHSDTSFRRDPSMLSILRAISVPEIGGETMWADMAAAYDNIPDGVRERIDDLTATHTFVKSWGLTMTDEAIAEMESIHPRTSHPVVRTHPETGRKFLYVNEPFTEAINGLPGEEANDLLDYLLFQARVPEYQVRFRWEPGSVAMWDNRITQHYAISDYFPQRRVMERVTVVGDQPF
ncbi:taurine dioxygenase [Rhodococcus wratislaviensis]|uniref:Taurine dioxygenase n=1 Tax=Rhodococcus wratislaviensis TaxID=44752 RepID=A0AB38F8Z4_RHOWR|nr:TauD/TfdA family dioxygenase [Rhodococcus wratislaviensis]REE73095.1 taurine dioxygenase [Rhodococcus wratislaviensis]SPZ37885.1 taurine dioxygenase [Rhodococcus wratislaviensis]